MGESVIIATIQKKNAKIKKYVPFENNRVLTSISIAAQFSHIINTLYNALRK